MEETQFNFDLFEREAIAGLRSGKKLEGKDGVLPSWRTSNQDVPRTRC